MKFKLKQKSPRKKTSGIEPTIFWKIAEDIPKSLSWLMMAFSILIPFIFPFIT